MPQRLTRLAAAAWRGEAAAVDPDLVPLLSAERLTGLVWWATRAARLRRTFLEQSAHVANLERRAEAIVALLNDAGIRALLIKGWAVGRLYPDAALRPYGDIDLCVRPDQLSAARAAVDRLAGPPGEVDLHAGVADLPDRSWNGVTARASRARLGAVEVDVLGAEDQLRLVCLHFVRHGGRLLLRLCDVAACLRASPGLDWGRCLAGDRFRSAWVRCVVALAGRVLGIDVPFNEVPPWVEATARRLWLRPRARPVAEYVTRPDELAADLRCHGSFNVVRAAYALGRAPETRVPLALMQAMNLGRDLPGRAASLFTPRPTGGLAVVHRR